MASLTAWMQAASQYWYIPAALVVLGALAAYGYAYFCALRPRGGTLEWIAFHDRPHLMLQTAGTLTRRDIAGIAGVAVLTLAAWSVALLPALLLRADLSVNLALASIAYNSALPVLNAVLAYVLMKLLGGSTAAAILGGSLLGLNLLAEPTASVFVTASGLLACLFASRSQTRSFGANVCYLVLCAAALTVGCYFCPALSLFAAAVLALLVASCVLRFINRGKPDGYLPKTLAVFVAAVAVTTLLVFLPAASLWGRPLLLAPFSAAYYQMIAQRVTELFTGLFGFQRFDVLSALYYDWPLLATGFLAVVAALVSLLRRRDGQGLILTLLLLGVLAMWLLAGSYAVPTVCTIALSCVWAALLRRGKRGLVAAGAAVLLVATTMFNAFIFWFPGLFR